MLLMLSIFWKSCYDEEKKLTSIAQNEFSHDIKLLLEWMNLL